MNARTLMKVEIDDAAMADDIFSMLMGEKVQPRKVFIEAHGHGGMADEIDVTPPAKEEGGGERSPPLFQFFRDNFG